MGVGFFKKGLKWLSILPLGGGTIALTIWLVHANKPLNKVYDSSKKTEVPEKTKEDKKKLADTLKKFLEIDTDDIFGIYEASVELKGAEESIKKIQDDKGSSV